MVEGLVKLKDLVGAKLSSVEVIRAEYGRTYNSYILVKAADGRRAVVASHGCPGDPLFEPRPPLDEMRKAPGFFTPEEIADRMLRDEQEARGRAAAEVQRKRRDLERLKRELGEA